MRRLLVVLGLGVLGSGCLLVVKKDRVATVRRVAVVGYSGVLAIEDWESDGALAAAVAAARGNRDAIWKARALRRQEQAVAGYQDLARRLGGRLGWEVLEASALGASPVYQQLLSRGAAAREGLQALPGVLLEREVRDLSPEALQALASALGVDGLAAVEVHFEGAREAGVSIAGLGSVSRSPRAWARFTLVDASGEVVWRDARALGVVTRGALRSELGKADVGNESAVLGEAAGSAFEALLTRLEAAPAR
jgi:hypothetical protein